MTVNRPAPTQQEGGRSGVFSNYEGGIFKLIGRTIHPYTVSMRTFYAIKDKRINASNAFLNLNHLRIRAIQLDQLIKCTSSCSSQNDINSAGIAGAVLQHLVNQPVFSNWQSNVAYVPRIGCISTSRSIFTIRFNMIVSGIINSPENLLKRLIGNKGFNEHIAHIKLISS